MEAMIELIDRGNPQPTARQIASQARVSVRLVYHHFAYLEILYLSAAELQASRHGALVAMIPPHGPVATRIRTTCHQRRQLFEVIGAVLRSVQSRTQGSPKLNGNLSQLRSRLRRQLTVTLGPEISARGAQAEILLETIELATGWQNWNTLRFDRGLSASAAEQLMVFAVTRLLC